MKMRILIILLLIVSVFSCKSKIDNFDVIIEDITIIDVKNSELVPNQTICIKGNKIENITASHKIINVIADTVINAKGKFISSGFWDMHVHTCWKDELDKTTFPIFLRYGITGLRDMGGSLETLNNFKQRAKHQPYLYPNLFGAGPILDGENPVHPSFSVPVTTENFRIVLDSLRNEQVDFFKVYSLLPKDVMDSIATYSKVHKIHFSGHVSEYISPEEASNLGYKSFEHLNKLEELVDDSKRLNTFIGLTKKNKNWLCPTLLIYKRKYEMSSGEFFNHSLEEELDEDLKAEWNFKKRLAQRAFAENENETDSLKFEKQKELVKYFYDNKIPFLLGTDFAGMPFIYPGYSFHEEMMLMNEIGISEFEILKIATWNPAIYLGISDSYGTVEENKVADLIIFNKNPIDKIENTLSIDLVMKSGKIIKQ